MRNQFIFGLLMLLVLLNGWWIITADLPFSQIDLVLAGLSLIVMTILSSRFIFLYLAIIVLGYGGFLTGYSFWFNYTGTIQTQYIYDHLLVTSFLLLYWVLVHQMKTLAMENKELEKKVAKLEKIDKDTQILTPDEFLYQARYILSSTKRHGEAWLVEMDIYQKGVYTQDNLQEYLESIVLHSIRGQFDIVTAAPGKIYFILKDTDQAGIDIVFGRIATKRKEVLNLLEAPYDINFEIFTDEHQLDKVEGVLA